MESRPQNPEFRNNPERLSPMHWNSFIFSLFCGSSQDNHTVNHRLCGYGITYEELDLD